MPAIALSDGRATTRDVYTGTGSAALPSLGAVGSAVFSAAPQLDIDATITHDLDIGTAITHDVQIGTEIQHDLSIDFTMKDQDDDS